MGEWEQTQEFEDATPFKFKGEMGLSILPTDVASAAHDGTSGVAKADHVHRGVGALEVDDTYLRGNIELIEGSNISLTISESNNTITVDLDDDIEVDSITAETGVFDFLDITDTLSVDVISPSRGSPGGSVLLTGDVDIDGILGIDRIQSNSRSPDGNVEFLSDVHLPTGIDLTLADLSGTVITTTNVETSLEELDASQAAEYNSGFDSWTSGADANTYTVDGTGFQVDRSGLGYIKGVAVTWAASQKTAALAANTLNYIYMDSNGTIGSSTSWSNALFEDNIVLFECLYDGTNYVTVREDHPVRFPINVSTNWHEILGPTIHGLGTSVDIGADITRVATGTGAAAGDREIKIVGQAFLNDHGLSTTISDSAGAGVTWNWYYTNVGGNWVRHAQQTQAPMVYNNAGAIANIDNGKYGVFRMYVSKNDIESSSPLYFSVLGAAQYNNLAQARVAIAAGMPEATNELFGLELAQLGYIIVLDNAAGGYIAEVQVEKSVLQGTTTGAGASNLASLISVVADNFDGPPTEVLSSTDTIVQNALETINDFLKTGHNCAGDWQFAEDVYVSGQLYVDSILPDSESPDGVLNIDGTDITSTQWGYVGNLDQDLATTDNVSFGDCVLTGGDLDIGVDDTTAGRIDVFGGGAATGGQIILYNGAALDSSQQGWVFAAADSLQIWPFGGSAIVDLDQNGLEVGVPIYVDVINPYSASPDSDIILNHTTNVQGDLTVDGNIIANNIGDYVAVRKTANETVNNSAVLQEDDELTFDVVAGDSWVILYELRVSGNDTADFKFLIDGTSTLATDNGWGLITGVANPTTIGTFLFATNTAETVQFIGGATQCFIRIYAAVVVTGSGTLTLTWAQGTATGVNTIILEGSSVRAFLVK